MRKVWLETKHFSIITDLYNCLIGIELMPEYDFDSEGKIVFIGHGIRIGFGLFELVFERVAGGSL